MIKYKKKIAAALTSCLLFAHTLVLEAHAADVASAITSTWNSAKSEIKTITNNVIFPVLDMILAILLFVKIGASYLDYRKHGQIEWTPIAIIFFGLLFTLTAPMYVWSIVNI